MDLRPEQILFKIVDLESYFSTKYALQAREEFVEEFASYVQEYCNVSDEVIAEMKSEQIFMDLFDQTIQHIEEQSVALIMTFNLEDDNKINFPMFVQSPVGSLFSLFTHSHMDMLTDMKKPTENFYLSLVQMTNSEPYEWGKIDPELYESLHWYEQQAYITIKEALIYGSITKEITILFKIAESEVDQEEYDT